MDNIGSEACSTPVIFAVGTTAGAEHCGPSMAERAIPAEGYAAIGGIGGGLIGRG